LLLAFHNDFDAAKKEYPEGRRVVITGPLWQTHMPRVEDVQRAEMRMVQGKWSPLDGPPLPKAALWLGPAGVAPPGAPAILPATEMDADDELSRPGVIGEARQSSDENGNPAWFGQSLGYFYIWNFGESLTLNCRIYSAHRLPPEKTVEVLGVERTVKRLVDISIGLDDCVLMRRGSDEPTRTAVPDDVDKTAQESSSTTTSTNQTTPGSASQQQPAPSEPTSTKAPDITFQSTESPTVQAPPVPTPASRIAIGQTEQQVIGILGTPSSITTGANRIFNYPDFKLVFRDGVLVQIRKD
jgi:hypothetical protein